jgi:DNA-binding winged helix-turn-helix (wHTH) protein
VPEVRVRSPQEWSQDLFIGAYMNNPGKSLYKFGDFRLDPGRRLLWKQDQPIQLQPKAFDTLLVLVQHNDRVVSKDELMKLVWPDAFVEESNLTQNIFVLRKTLGETAGAHRFIVTVPGRGYRFAEMVRTIGEADYVVVESHSQSRVIVEEEDMDPGDDTVTVGFPDPRRSTQAISERMPRSRLMFASIAAGAAIVAAFAIYAVGGFKTKPAFQTMTMERVTNAGEVKRGAISPDGKYLAFAAGEPGKVGLWVRQVATHSDIEICRKRPWVSEV